MKKMTRKLFAVLLAGTMTIGATGLSALALDVDISLGDVTISSEDSKTSVSHTAKNEDGSTEARKNTLAENESVHVTQSEEGSTSNTITVERGVQGVDITLGGVNIDTTGSENKAAVEIKERASANIELDGENRLSGNGTVRNGGAGLQVDNEAEVTITDADDNGKLTATGGLNAAGIGSNGNVGRGDDTYTDTYSKNTAVIEIVGGTVEAVGGQGIGGVPGGAGNGGGNHRDGGTITIGGDANVTATGVGGAGIGSGTASSKDKVVNKQTGETIQLNGGNITIKDDAVVKATTQTEAAGIGGGMYADGGNITITGSAKVEATGGPRGAGIGGGYQGNGGNITISGDAEVKAAGGNKDSYNGLVGGAGIGGGTEGAVSSKTYTRGGGAGNITITDNAEVEATGGIGASGIGSGASLEQKKVEDGYKSAITEGKLIITKDAQVVAFADGTKWAIDIDDCNVEEVTNLILQGRFLPGILDGTVTELYIAKDTSGGWTIMMPEKYRSYASTVPTADVYYVQATKYTPTGVESFKSYDFAEKAGDGAYRKYGVAGDLIAASNDHQHLAEVTIPAPGTDPGTDLTPGTDPNPGTDPTPDTDPTPGDTDITDEDVPMSDLPSQETPAEETAAEELAEPEVPLADLPDQDVPLAEIPRTGDVSALWLAMTVLSGCALMGLAFLSFRKRKEA